MKRRLYLTAAMLGMGVFLFAGCGNDQKNKNSVNGTESTELAATDAFDYDVNDYVKLGEYKKLAVRYPVPVLTEDDVQMEIEYLLDENTQYNEMTDRGAQDGDLLSITYTGTIDGKEFDGGSDSDYEFILGDEEFFEDFEKNLIGKKAGETFSFKTIFPEDYDEELNGQEAEFSVTMNSISEIVVPEYNDAFIKEVTDYDTVAAYEEGLQEELMVSAQNEAMATAGEDALQMAIANAEITGYPQQLYDACYESTMQEYQEYADMIGIELSEFIDDDSSLEDEVLNWVNEILVSQAIAEKEGFEITDDNYSEDAGKLAEEFGYTALEEFQEDYGEVYVKVNLMKDKAVRYLYENAEVEEVSEEEYYSELEGEELEEIEGESDSGTEILFEDDTE
ncbi:MAG: trigger factor [Eubacterium sp.]|jgi:trigger factor|nr:trigger factor [Eubacterium sp.]